MGTGKIRVFSFRGIGDGEFLGLGVLQSRPHCFLVRRGEGFLADSFSSLFCVLCGGHKSSDIRKWFMKAQDKNGGAAKPAGTTALAKKPVLSIPEKPSSAPSMVQCQSFCLCPFEFFLLYMFPFVEEFLCNLLYGELA